MFKKKIAATLRLFRLELPLAAGICVLLGELIALGRFPGWFEGLLGFACGFFISSSALILNDVFDLEVDRINAPERPLPSGLVSPKEALVLTALVSLLGLLAAAYMNMTALVLSAVFWLVGILYNWKFKSTGLLGNLMVASSVGFTIVLGGVIVGGLQNVLLWVFALIAFFVDLGEEIAGDAMDMEGDRQRDSKSLAILLGRQPALRISSLMFGMVILVGFIPIVLGLAGIVYLVVIGFIDLLIVIFTIKLLRSRTSDEGHRAMRVIYIGASLAILAFIVGQWLV